jgi:MerR family transcriptional regulator, mercuric resistance operon regulatory protein
MTPSAISVGALAAAAGVGVETIRFYQRRGLVALPARPPRGPRVYSRDTVDRLRFIKAAQAWGFSLHDVAELLRLQDGTGCDEARSIAVTRLAIVTKRRRELRRIEAALRGAIAACGSRTKRVSCPLIASLRATDV